MEEKKTAQEASGDDCLFVEEPIQAIRQKFNYLTELWLLEDIDDDKYQEELARMVYTDTEGALWFISPLNGNWYNIFGEEPELGEPPPTLLRPPRALLENTAATPPATAASNIGVEKQGGKGKFCTHCGSMLREGANFCRECGTPVKGRGGNA